MGKWDFTVFQKGFAFVALALGYLLVRFLACDCAPGAGALIFFDTAIVTTLVFMLKQGAVLRGVHYVWMGLLMLFPASFILTDDPGVKGFGVWFMIFGFMYWVYICSAGVPVFRQSFIRDFMSATFASPFRNFVALPVAICKPARNSRGKVMRYVGLGLLVTIPFTLIIAALLLSSDETFRNLMGYENIADEIGEFLGRMFFAVPVGMVIFSVLVSGIRGKDAVKGVKQGGKGGRVNHIVFITAYIPVLLLYIAFFVSQYAYFTGAFSSILPENLTYAEYARQGFFELCAVVAINLLMVLLTELLCKKNERGHFSGGIKAVISLLSFSSFALVAIFVAKMVMYTDNYGFTHKRILTLWFTAVLALIVAIALVKVFVPRFRFYGAAVTAFVLMFALLSFVNVNGIIAKYNVKWYQEGKISWMGEEALYELDYSAVKYLDALYDDDTMAVNEINPEYRDYYYTGYDWDTYYSDDTFDTVSEQVKDFYRYLASFDNGFIGYSIPATEAERVFAQRGVEPFAEESDSLAEDDIYA